MGTQGAHCEFRKGHRAPTVRTRKVILSDLCNLCMILHAWKKPSGDLLPVLAPDSLSPDRDTWILCLHQVKHVEWTTSHFSNRSPGAQPHSLSLQASYRLDSGTHTRHDAITLELEKPLRPRGPFMLPSPSWVLPSASCKLMNSHPQVHRAPPTHMPEQTLT